jgi:hypothetical protein
MRRITYNDKDVPCRSNHLIEARLWLSLRKQIKSAGKDAMGERNP